MTQPLVTLRLIETSSDGTITATELKLFRPRDDGRGAYACLVSLSGTDNHKKDIYGEDSLQALCLGLRMFRLHLELILSRGSRLAYPDGTEFQLSNYFETPPTPTKPLSTSQAPSLDKSC